MILIAIAVGVSVASYVMAVQAQKKAEKAAKDMAGVLVNKESNVEPIPVIYGERRVGGTRVYMATQNADDGDDIPNEYLYMCLVLCEGEVESITNLQIDGNDITDFKYSSLVDYNVYTGTNNQTADQYLKDSDSSWTNAHKLSGVAYVALRLKWDETAFQGVPTITALVKGRKIYDPRKDSTSVAYDASLGVSSQRKGQTATWSYSINPALCIRDYLTNTRYGKGLPQNVIDDVAFGSAAEDCTEIITPFLQAAAIPLFQCHAVLQTSKTLFENIEILLMGCRGFLPFSEGKYSLVIDKARNSTFVFDIDNMTSALQISGTPKDKKYNQATVKFSNQEIDFEPDEVTWPNPNGTTSEINSYNQYLTEDNNTELLLNVDLETVKSHYLARDLARVFVEKSRNQKRIAFKATSDALNVSVGDTVTVKHPTLSPNLSPKLFQVEEVSLNYDGTVSVSLVDYIATTYSYKTANVEPDNLNPNFPDPFAVASPGTLTSVADSFIGADGSAIPRITVTWVAANDAFVSGYNVEWKKASEGNIAYRSIRVVGTKTELPDIEVGISYDIRVSSVNAMGVTSEAVTTTTAGVGDTTAPGVPTNPQATGAYKSILLTFVTPTATDLSHVNIYRSNTANGTYSVVATVSCRPKNVNGTWTAQTEEFINGGLASNTQYFYKLSSVDFSGNQSSLTSQVNATTDAVALDGQSTFQASVYKRSATALTAPSGGGFNFGTNFLTPPTGWSKSVPTGTLPIYTCTYLFKIVGDTGTDTANTWSIPNILAENGSPATSTFTFNIYKRKSGTAPPTPTGGSYNFSTNAIGLPGGGWSSTVPSGTDPVYLCTTIATTLGPTGVDSPLTWSAPSILVENGESGARSASGYLYYQIVQNATPPTPTASGYNFTTGVFSDLANNWQTEPVETTVADGTYWASYYFITEDELGGTQSRDFNAPFKSVVFDGLVTFTNLNQELAKAEGVSDITTINGGLITTGKVKANRIEIDDVTLDTVNIGGVPTLVIKAEGVDTIHIEDNAVTIPVVSNTVGTVYEHFTDPTKSGSELNNTNFTVALRTFKTPIIGSTKCTLTAQQLNINVTSGNTPVLINFTGTILTNMRGPVDGDNFIYFELLRGSTVIKSFFHGEAATSAGFLSQEDHNYNTAIERQAWLERNGLLLNMSHVDDGAPSGTNTYKLRYRWLAEDTFPFFDNHHSLRNNCTMTAVELQK